MRNILSDQKFRAQSVHTISDVNVDELLSMPLEQGLGIVQGWNLTSLVGLFNVDERGRTLTQRALHDQLRTLIGQLTGDIKFFLDAMAVTNTVLSGSAALRFADRQANWAPTDFDFYSSKFGFDGFCFFLEYYLHARVLEDHDKPDTYLIEGKTGAIIERKCFQLGNTKVDVMRSATPSPFYPLTTFHSTLLMNAITFDSLVIAYPHHVSHKVGISSMHSFRPSALAATAKYEVRGYRLLPWDSLEVEEGGGTEGGACSNYRRYFGDSRCLTVPFSPCPAKPRSHGPNEDGEWTAGWILGGRPCVDNMCENCSDSFSYTALIVKGGRGET